MSDPMGVGVGVGEDVGVALGDGGGDGVCDGVPLGAPVVLRNKWWRRLCAFCDGGRSGCAPALLAGW